MDFDFRRALDTKLAIPLWPDCGKGLGKSRSATYDAAKAGQIPTFRIGNSILVPVPKLRALLGLEPELPREAA
jgi:hypothetical protein